MSERIKSKSVQKLLTEEKQLYQAEISAITSERDRYSLYVFYTLLQLCRLNTLVQKLEDRDKNSEAAIASSEKELALKQQAVELYKKKVRKKTHEFF